MRKKKLKRIQGKGVDREKLYLRETRANIRIIEPIELAFSNIW